MKTSTKSLLVAIAVGISAPCIHYVQKQSVSEAAIANQSDMEVPLSSETVAWEETPATSPVVVHKPTKKSDKKYTKLGWKDLGELNAETGKAPAKLLQALKSPVMVPGYIVPISDGSDNLDSFLVVPEPMMCVHVPAPPPEYIVMAQMKNPLPFPDDFSPWEPFWIKGKLVIEKTENDLAVAAYNMKVDEIEKYELPLQDQSTESNNSGTN